MGFVELLMIFIIVVIFLIGLIIIIWFAWLMIIETKKYVKIKRSVK